MSGNRIKRENGGTQRQPPAAEIYVGRGLYAQGSGGHGLRLWSGDSRGGGGGGRSIAEGAWITRGRSCSFPLAVSPHPPNEHAGTCSTARARSSFLKAMRRDVRILLVGDGEQHVPLDVRQLSSPCWVMFAM